MTSVQTELATRSPLRLAADPSRVVNQLFVPGQEGFEHQESRAGVVVRRILALAEEDVQASLDDVITRFDGRHRDLIGTFRRHADVLADRLHPGRQLSEARKVLLGAAFTSEYAIEGAALCNPSMVAHPDQTGTAAGSLRFVMSVRGIGEGHQSSIGFRTGTVDAAGDVAIDETAPFAMHRQGPRRRFSTAPCSATSWPDSVGQGGRRLRPRCPRRPLHPGRPRRTTRHACRPTSAPGAAPRPRSARSGRSPIGRYSVGFADDTSLPERVLRPAMGAEAAGMEDARFVRFVDDDGSVTYYATYTAYSGSHISQQLLETRDFTSFTSRPIVGRAAANKGLALFPRRIDGRFAAMSRSDRETNTLAYSDNLLVWANSVPCQQPVNAWEVLQLGNCGPPIETDVGWLALTHGVGPMRTYSIGAVLLDLDDPSRIIGRLRRPLLTPAPDEQNGYVPNVVYSCGALVHAETLVIPYGISDAAIGFATVAMPKLLEALTG